MRTRRTISPAVWLFAIGAIAGSGDLPSTDSKNPAVPPTSEPVAAGELMDDRISFEFAIYYLPEPAKDPLSELNVLLKETFGEFQKVKKIPDQVTSPVIFAEMRRDIAGSYAPPGMQSLQYSGKGLSREQAQALQNSKAVLLLDFAYSKAHVWEGMRSAVKLTEALAVKTGGLPWDEETRQVFSSEKWKQDRIDDWTVEVPDLSKHTTIHAYDNGGHVRAITLGMAKFGLPDIVVDEFSWSLNRTVGHTINLLAQAIAEGGRLKAPGQFDLQIKAIKNPKVREPQLASLKPNATGEASLSLRKGTWEEGDPKNRLIEITFDRHPGPDLHARQEKMLSELFGWEDSVTRVKHDSELDAASERARAKLPSLRETFNKGLAPGEFIQVKAPFATPEGSQEWMWVEVTSWKGEKITGLLKNEPFDIPDLHAGQIVEVSQGEVFDFIRNRADGTAEGNETGALIEKRNPATEKRG